MLHYDQVFRKVFERRGSKFLCSIDEPLSQSYKCEQVITLQIAKQLKPKNINVVSRQLFCRQCKAKFLLETDPLF